MARGNPIKFLRTTRANLDTQSAAAGLLQGEPYLITDEKVLAIGLSTSSYAVLALASGCCVLAKVSSNLVLSPRNGDSLRIDGIIRQVPSAGVSLAPPSDTVTMTIASPAVVTWNSHGLVAGRPIRFSTSGALPTGVTAGQVYYVIATGLTTNTFQFSASVGGAAVNTSGSQSGTHKIGTLRFIYAYMNSATMTLEASTTARATSSTAGNRGTEIKSGDDTRSLVGMAFDYNGGWIDTAAERFVRSWFNRARGATLGAFTAARSVSSTGFSEFHTEARIQWLQWADEIEDLSASGGMYNLDANGGNLTIFVDGNALDAYVRKGATTANVGLPFGFSAPFQASADSYHWGALTGMVDAGTGIGITGSGSAATRTTLRSAVQAS